jgi:hypothetical protein
MIRLRSVDDARHGSRDAAQLFSVVAESMLHSDVKRGENGGRSSRTTASPANRARGSVATRRKNFPPPLPPSAREWNRSGLAPSSSCRSAAATTSSPQPPSRSRE